MKKTKIFLFIALILAANISVNAQNEDNALIYSTTRPTGTARSIGLGGAMGALGADFTAISINPAGIAVYRSSEFAFTPSLIFNQTESNYYNVVSEDDKFSFPINHISYVATDNSMRNEKDGLISTHFGIGYNRTNNFNRNSFIQGNEIGSSLLDEFVYNADRNGLTPFYSKLAFEALLIDPISETSDNYYSAFEYLDEDSVPQWGLGQEGLNQSRIISENGSSGEFTLAFGGNYSNKIFFGGSLGITTLQYEKVFEHYEEVAPAENQWNYLDHYSFHDKLRTTGTGINLKVGAIFKPIHSLRLGASFHSPSFYSINEEFSTSIDLPQGFADQTEFKSDFGENTYNFRTPFKAIGSFAYILGTRGLISIDYEYSDYGNMEYKSQNAKPQGIIFFRKINNRITNTFNPTHNLKMGVELKINPFVALRGGYATYQNPYNTQLVIKKEDAPDEVFEIQKDKYDISGGIGFKHQNLTVDVAYLYRTQSYINSLYYSGYVPDEFQYPVTMTSTDHQLAVTLGWRF